MNDIDDFYINIEELKSIEQYDLNLVGQFIGWSIFNYRSLRLINKTTISDIQHRILRIKINDKELSINL